MIYIYYLHIQYAYSIFINDIHMVYTNIIEKHMYFIGNIKLKFRYDFY